MTDAQVKSHFKGTDEEVKVFSYKGFGDGKNLGRKERRKEREERKGKKEGRGEKKMEKKEKNSKYE